MVNTMYKKINISEAKGCFACNGDLVLVDNTGKTYQYKTFPKELLQFVELSHFKCAKCGRTYPIIWGDETHFSPYIIGCTQKINI